MVDTTKEPGYYRTLLENISSGPVPMDPPLDQGPSTPAPDEGAMMFRGRAVDPNSIEVGGVDHRDYPDFADAYISAADYTDGTPLSNEELDDFHDENHGLAHELAHSTLSEVVDAAEPGNPGPDSPQGIDAIRNEAIEACINMVRRVFAESRGQKVQPSVVARRLVEGLAGLRSRG